MVTIDGIVKNVGKFDGNIRRHRTYERAKENIAKIDKDDGMLKLEKTLKRETGYNDIHLPIEPDTYSLTKEGITFNVRSEKTTKKPQYKKAVEHMENYIVGINKLVNDNKIITWIPKENDMWCISVDNLLQQYDVIISGVKSPGVKQTITYEADEKLMKAPKIMNMSVYSNGKLTTDNFLDYIRRDSLRIVADEYVTAYEKELKMQKKIKGIVPVNTRKGIKVDTTKSEGSDWAYVVKTLVNDDEKSPGELNFLADNRIPMDFRISMNPQYDLFVRTPKDDENQGRPKLYIGIRSVYNRIQQLKEGKSIVSNRTTYTAKELV
jgi:hypothetical protein